MLVYMRISYISLVIFSRFSMKQYAVGQTRKNNYPATLHQSVYTKLGQWLKMYIRLRCIGFVIFFSDFAAIPATVHQSACTNPGRWLDMYIRLRCIGFVIFSTILLLTPPLVIKVPVPSLSDSRTCMCVMCVDCFDDFYNRCWSW